MGWRDSRWQRTGSWGIALLLAALAVRLPARETILSSHILEGWKSRDGLPQNTATAIAQTGDGNVWFATQEGLARFDGVSFRVFDKTNTPGLRVGHFSALLGCRDGGLLAASWREGIYRYRPGELQLAPVPFPSNPGIINAMAEGVDGALWIGTESGLLRLKGGVLTRFGKAQGLADEQVRTLLAAADRTLWIGTAEGGLYAFRDGRLQPFGRERGLPDDRVSALATAADGAIWVGSGERLCRISGDRIVEVWRAAVPFGDRIRALADDRLGNVWIGFENGGLARWRESSALSLTSREGLAIDAVISLCVDREGSVWIGTAGGGVSRLRDRKVKSVSLSEGLTYPVLWTVLESRDGSLWMGTNGGGLNRLHPDGRVTAYGPRDGLADLVVTGLCEGRDGSLWAGTGSHGLYRMDPGGRFRPVPLGSTLNERTVWAVYEDRGGGIWVGTAGGVFRRDGGRWRRYSTRDGLAGDSVRAFSEGPDGSLWMASDTGLSCLRAGNIRAWGAGSGLPATALLSSHADSEGTLWLGSRNSGLVLLRHGRFSRITTTQGLFDDYAYQILEDGRRNLWISCNKGIFRVVKDDLLAVAENRAARVSCDPFDDHDGMLNSECNGARFPAGVRARDGRLCFPTMDGLAVIEPERMRINRVVPPVHIENLRVNGRWMPPRQGQEFQPGRNDLEFRFTALSLRVPAKVRFRYRLRPYETAWREAGDRREAFYTNIPPGAYSFEVIACNDDGLWNDSGARLGFRLRPSFRQTPWFWLLLLALAGALTLIGVRLRLRRLRHQKQALERQVHERTAQLEQALGKLEEIANTDGLTGVANRRCFEEWLQREWRRSMRPAVEMSVLLLDVDFFKAYNDTYGHVAGDHCLKQVAGVMTGLAKRSADLVGRYGGEEFILIMPATDSAGAQVLAGRILAGVERLAIPHSASPYHAQLTVSIGLASLTPQRDMSVGDLIAAADKALYAAKLAGRNRFVVHCPA